LASLCSAASAPIGLAVNLRQTIVNQHFASFLSISTRHLNTIKARALADLFVFSCGDTQPPLLAFYDDCQFAAIAVITSSCVPAVRSVSPALGGANDAIAATRFATPA